MKRGRKVLIALVLVVVLLGVFAGPALAKTFGRLLYSRPYEELVGREAEEFSLDSDLIYAVMHTESRFDIDAESRAGAKGLMQLTPATFEWIASLYPPENGGGDMFDPGDNIHCGCALLRLLLDEFGSTEVALCAYNAGMGNVEKWLMESKYSHDGENLHTIPYPETDSYLKKVRQAIDRYKWLYEN